ncbi:MAG: hypothetical protein ACRDID_12475, partial [Ktedonobacterales bacterium]
YGRVTTEMLIISVGDPESRLCLAMIESGSRLGLVKGWRAWDVRSGRAASQRAGASATLRRALSTGTSLSNGGRVVARIALTWRLAWLDRVCLIGPGLARTCRYCSLTLRSGESAQERLKARTRALAGCQPIRSDSLRFAPIRFPHPRGVGEWAHESTNWMTIQ